MILGLTPLSLSLLGGIAALAGLVRGFTGFALSAVALALGVTLLAPVELIPVLWWLEIGASLMMLSGTMRDADWRMTLVLVICSAIGVQVGLSWTVRVDPDISRLVALSVLIALAALLLARLRLPFLASVPGQIGSGLLAGIVTGLAGIGGMVIAVFVLAQNSTPRVMRASLVAFLFLSSATSFAQHLWFGTMTELAVMRGFALLPVCLLGVWLGQRLFVPKYEPYYRPVCLTLLIVLAGLSLLRSLM